MRLRFMYFRWFWLTDYGWPDVSFGVHFCAKGRVDIHFLKWMFSIGRVPIYFGSDFWAVSNSFHENRSKPFRAGTPQEHYAPPAAEYFPFSVTNGDEYKVIYAMSASHALKMAGLRGNVSICKMHRLAKGILSIKSA